MKVRKQFKMPLSSMEAIQEKFNNMVYNTWIIQSAVSLTNDILDNGNSPAVLSAIMKQQCTERGTNSFKSCHGYSCRGSNLFRL